MLLNHCFTSGFLTSIQIFSRFLEQLFAPSQLNALSKASWYRILLFGHDKLKRPHSLQFMMQFANFSQLLWRSCVVSYLSRTPFYVCIY